MWWPLGGRLVTDGLENAVGERAPASRICSGGPEGRPFRTGHRSRLRGAAHKAGRPEHEGNPLRGGAGCPPSTNEIEIAAESGLLKTTEGASATREGYSPACASPSRCPTAHHDHRWPRGGKHGESVFKKSPGGNDNYLFGAHQPGRPGAGFSPGPRKLTLANLPEDDVCLPAPLTWLKHLLMDGVRQYVLNSRLMRNPSPPHLRRELRPDGSNLPWVGGLTCSDVHRSGTGRGSNTCGPSSVCIWRRDHGRARRRIDTATSSSNTIPACAPLPARLRWHVAPVGPDRSGRTSQAERHLLIEEPEIGIHPRAVETVFQSLSSV